MNLKVLGFDVHWLDMSPNISYTIYADVKQYASIKNILKFKMQKINEVHRRNFKQVKRIINQKL